MLNLRDAWAYGWRKCAYFTHLNKFISIYLLSSNAGGKLHRKYLYVGNLQLLSV